MIDETLDRDEPYYSPIDLLKPDIHRLLSIITDQFPPDLQEAVLAAKISIMHDDRPLKLRTPFADLSSNQVNIQDTHLCFLWCCSYTMVALNKMYYEKAKLDQAVVTFDDIPEFKTVQLTLRWAKSLKHKVSTWPEDAARPDKPGKWIDEATSLFQPCVAYFIFHEIAHLLLHKDMISLRLAQKKSDYKPNETDKKRVYDAEVEADQFALDRLMGSSTDVEIRMTKFHAATLAHLSNFYLLDVPDTRGFTHPDIDVRLRTVLNQIDLTDEASKIQLGAHMTMGLQLFFSITGKDFHVDNPVYETFEELEAHLFGLIDQMKEAARIRNE